MATNQEKLLPEENPILAAAARANSSVVPAAVSSASQSTSTTIKETTTAKNVEDITTDSVLDDITAGIEQGNVLATQRQNQIKAQSDKSKETGDLIVTNAVNEQVIKKQADIAVLEAETGKKAVFEARGGTEELIRLAKLKRAAAENVIKTQAAIEENVNVDFSSDPVQWLVNKLTIGAIGEENAVARGTYRQLDNIQDNFTSFANATDQALDSVKTTATAATLAAGQKNIAAIAQQKSLAFGIEADRLNAEATQVAMNMTKDETSAQIQKWQILQQERAFKATQKERTAIAERAGKDRRVMDAIIDGTIEGRKRRGLTTYTGTDAASIIEERSNIEAKFSIGGESRKEIEALFDIGIGVTKPTAYDSLNAISLYDPASLTDGKNPALNTLTGSLSDVITDSQGTATKPKFKLTKDNVGGLVEAKFKANMESYEAEIVEGDTTNPNRALPLSALVVMSGVAEEPLATQVLIPLLIGETKDYTPNQTIDLAFAAVKTARNPEGVLTFEQAVSGIAAIYSKAAVVNTTSQKREQLNLRPQTSYNTKVSPTLALPIRSFGSGIFKGKKGNIVDLMDTTVLRALGLRVLGGNLGLSAERIGIDPKLEGDTGDLLDFLNTNRGEQ